MTEAAEPSHGGCVELMHRKEPTDMALKGFLNALIHSLIYSLAVYSGPIACHALLLAGLLGKAVLVK